MPNEAASQNDIDTQLTDHADARTNRWWQGSELYIKIFRDGNNSASAVVERLQQKVIDNDSKDYNHSNHMKELCKKEEAASMLVRKGILLNASCAPDRSSMLQIRLMQTPLTLRS
jgi:hypothetical protein